MPCVTCPIDGCTWKSQELPEALAGCLVQALTMHDKAVHSVTPVAANIKLKLDPPKLGIGASPEEWSSFKRQWDMYKKGTGIATDQFSTALFHCCSGELRQDIMRDIPHNISSLKEEVLLTEIKKLAVKEESILVHRMRLCKMTQSPGMGIRTFLANLRGQATLCNFTVACSEAGCTHVFNYSKEMIKDNLIRGLADPEIMADLLGDYKTDRNLEEVVSFVTEHTYNTSNTHT